MAALIPLRCADCKRRWHTRDGRALNVTPTGLNRIRCGACASKRARTLSAARSKAYRARRGLRHAHSAPITFPLAPEAPHRRQGRSEAVV